MGEYQFEMSASISDIITVDADSYDEAYAMAMDEADAWYAVAPAGFSMPWDYTNIDCISEPDDEEDDD